MLYWWLFTTCVFLPWVLEWLAQRFDLAHPKNAFLLYLYIQIGASWWIMQHLGAEFRFEGLSLHLREEDYDVAFLCASAGVVAFHVAYYVSTLVVKQARPPFEISASSSSINAATILVLLIGAVAFLGLLSSNGGMDEFIRNRQTWRSEGVAGQGFLLFPATTAPVLAVLLFLVKRFRHGIRKPGWLGYGLFAISLTPAAIIGFRGLLLLPVVQLLVVYAALSKGVSTKSMWLVLGCCLLAFTGYGLYRDWKDVAGDSRSLLEGLSAFLGERPEMMFDALLRSRGADAVAVVMSRIDTCGGYVSFLPTVVESATIVVPKIFWANKPVPLSVEYSRRFFGVNGGMAPTVIGELYWHMGWTGVLLGMTALGVAARWLYLFYKHLIQGSYWTVLYSFAYVYFVMSAEFIQGYLNSTVLTGVASGIVIMTIHRRRVPCGRLAATSLVPAGTVINALTCRKRHVC